MDADRPSRGGAKISASQTRTVDAYDKIEVVIPGGDSGSPGTTTVEVQPGGLDQVEFLVISSDHYDEALTYSITGGESDVKLDAQQLLVGKGAVGLLNAAPETLSSRTLWE